MDEHDELARCSGFHPLELHLGRERVLRFGEVVADDAIDDREHGRTFGSGDALTEEGRELGEEGVDAGADDVRDPADAPVDELGDDTGGTFERAAEDIGPARNRVVHPLDHVRHALRGIDDEPARAAQIISVRATRLLLFAHGCAVQLGAWAGSPSPFGRTGSPCMTRSTSSSMVPRAIFDHMMKSARSDQSGYLNVAGRLPSMKKCENHAGPYPTTGATRSGHTLRRAAAYATRPITAVVPTKWMVRVVFFECSRT